MQKPCEVFDHSSDVFRFGALWVEVFITKKEATVVFAGAKERLGQKVAAWPKWRSPVGDGAKRPM